MQPQSPNQNFDFILNDAPKKGGKLPMPNLGLPRPLKIGLLVVLVIFALIIVATILGGSKKSGSGTLTGLAAQAQEISRVSMVASQGSQDPSLQTLTTTVSSVMDSQEIQFTSYLKSSGQKIDPKALAADQNSATDTAMQTAIQNNNLSSVYSSYLVSALNSYTAQLSNEFKKASSSQLKSILNDDYSSVQTLLSSVNKS